MRVLRKIRFVNHHRITVSSRSQRQGVAAAWGSDGLGIDGRGAVFANPSIRPFEETHRPADLARVENCHQLAIGLFINKEAYLRSTLAHRKAMQISVGDLRHRNLENSIGKADLGGRRKRAHFLGINEFCGDEQNENERAGKNRNCPEALPARSPLRLAAQSGRVAGFGHWLPTPRFKQDH